MACNLRSFGWLVSLAAAAAAPAAGQSAGGAAAEERVIRSTEGFSKERAPDELRDPFTLEEHRSAKRSRIQPKSAGTQAVESTAFGDAWIFEASTELFQDLDRDGYYHYLRVRFDADTVFDQTLVYVKIFMSADGNAWEQLYATQDFADLGHRSRRRLRSRDGARDRLLHGPVRVLIELYDADDGDARRRVRAARVGRVLAVAARGLGARRRRTGAAARRWSDATAAAGRCLGGRFWDCSAQRRARVLESRSMSTLQGSRLHRNAGLAVLLAAIAAAPASAQPRPVARSITPITGDLYRASNGNWYTIFLVTPDGIILGDPINTEFAHWLKGELDSRFGQARPLRRLQP